MAETTTAPTNKLVAFRGRAEKERTMPDNTTREQGTKALKSEMAQYSDDPAVSAKRRKAEIGYEKKLTQDVADRVRHQGPLYGKGGVLAGHNPPKPHHAKTAGKHIPKHLRGRGLISAKAAAKMGQALAAEAAPPKGQHKPAMAKPPHGTHSAKAAKPWKGQKLPGWASPEHGVQDAARAHSDVE